MQDLCKAAQDYPRVDLVSAITAVSEYIISISFVFNLQYSSL